MKRKNIIQRTFMSLPELELYYQERRKERFLQGKPLKHIRLREVFYPVFAKFLTLDRIFRKQTIIVCGNQKKRKGRMIFACTHIGENDLEKHSTCYYCQGDKVVDCPVCDGTGMADD